MESVIVAALLLNTILLAVLLLATRHSRNDSVVPGLEAIQQKQHRLEQLIREESAQNRTETSGIARENRQELSLSFESLSESVFGRMNEFGQLHASRLDTFSAQLAAFVNAIEQKLSSSR